MIAAGDVIGLMSAAVLAGLAAGCWSGWWVGYRAGEQAGHAAMVDELEELLHETEPDELRTKGAL